MPRNHTTARSGQKGVYRVKLKWQACYYFGSMPVHLGVFDTFEQAQKAYQMYAQAVLDGKPRPTKEELQACATT